MDCIVRTRPVAQGGPSAPPAGQTWKLYYHAAGRPIAMRVLPPGNSIGTLYFLHSDHLGSVSAVTNLSGSAIARQWYHPYGSVRASTGGLPTDITFTGQRADASTGLYFYNARYYSGALGRFISADSIVPEQGNPQALNRYAYVLGNPLKYIDPTGHASIPSCAGKPDCGVNDPPSLLQPSAAFLQPTLNGRSGYCYGCDNGTRSGHPGIDYGDEPVSTIQASGNGIVLIADPCSAEPCTSLVGRNGATVNGGYGNVIVIEYPSSAMPKTTSERLGLSKNQSLFMLYGHLQDKPTLKVGATVMAGEIIGQIGTTGNSTGPHLHLEVRVGASGSLPPGEMCTTGCYPTVYDDAPRFSQWWGMPTIDPASIPFQYSLNVDYVPVARGIHAR